MMQGVKSVEIKKKKNGYIIIAFVYLYLGEYVLASIHTPRFDATFIQ